MIIAPDWHTDIVQQKDKVSALGCWYLCNNKIREEGGIRFQQSWRSPGVVYNGTIWMIPVCSQRQNDSQDWYQFDMVNHFPNQCQISIWFDVTDAHGKPAVTAFWLTLVRSWEVLKYQFVNELSIYICWPSQASPNLYVHTYLDMHLISHLWYLLLL